MTLSLTVPGKIVSGVRRASKLGFPTINVQYERGSRVPETGIYAGILEHGGKDYPGAICLGLEESGGLPKLEIHCFETFPASVGESVRCTFLEKLSDFVAATDEEMRIKIGRDVAKAKEFFENLKR